MDIAHAIYINNMINETYHYNPTEKSSDKINVINPPTEEVPVIIQPDPIVNPSVNQSNDIPIIGPDEIPAVKLVIMDAPIEEKKDTSFKNELFIRKVQLLLKAQNDAIADMKNQIVDLTKSANINSKVIQSNIKLLDHLIRTGNDDDIKVMNELLSQPEKLNPDALSYVSLTHLEYIIHLDFNYSLKKLDRYGVILTIDKLIEESNKCINIIENNNTSKLDNKLILKRLICGINQLIDAWKNNVLLNVTARIDLDKYALNEFKKCLTDGNLHAILKNKFAQKVDQLQEETFKQYVDKNLPAEEMDVLDKLILQNLEKWIFTSNPVQDVLMEKINENVKQILLKMLKNNEFDENLQKIFNIDNIITALMIFSENDLGSKFREEIYNEILIITNGNPTSEQKIKLMAEYKDTAIKNICNKWFTNKEILDKKIEKCIDKAVSKILVNKLKNEEMIGNFHTQIIREAISYLLEQFKTRKSFQPYVYGVLEDKIKTWIIYRKPQEHQKDQLIEAIILDLKKSNESDDKTLLLNSLKSHDLLINLEKMQRINLMYGSSLLSQNNFSNQLNSDINPNIMVQMRQLRNNNSSILSQSTIESTTQLS